MAGVAAQVAQQAVADAASGREPPELLLHRPQRLARTLCLREIEQHRVHGGEPADGAREVDVLEGVLAAVALQIDQQGAAARPAGEGLDQSGAQHVVDAGLIGAMDLLEQRAGLLGREGARDGARRALEPRVARAGKVDRQRRRGAAALVEPEGGLRRDLRRAGVGGQALGPALERGGLGGQRSPPA